MCTQTLGQETSTRAYVDVQQPAYVLTAWLISRTPDVIAARGDSSQGSPADVFPLRWGLAGGCLSGFGISQYFGVWLLGDVAESVCQISIVGLGMWRSSPRTPWSQRLSSSRMLTWDTREEKRQQNPKCTTWNWRFYDLVTERSLIAAKLGCARHRLATARLEAISASSDIIL